MDNTSQVELMLIRLLDVFPEKKLGVMGVEIYCDALRGMSVDAIESAIKECILTCRFFPTVADLLEKAQEAMDGGRNVEAEFLAVWRGGRPPADQPFLDALESVGGSRTVRDATSQDIQFLRRDFMKKYLNLQHRERTKGVTLRLAGSAIHPGIAGPMEVSEA